MEGFRLPIPAIAVLLVCMLIFTGPLTAVAQSDESQRALAMANADAIKQKALLRLSNEGTHISAIHQEQFNRAVRQVIDTQLDLLKRRYDIASSYLEEQIGYGTSLSAMWKSLWNSKEEAQRVFQEKIDAAMAHAAIPAARQQVNAALEAAVVEHATTLYKQSRQIFNEILYESIGESGLLGPLTKDLVKELIEHVDVTSHHLVVQERKVDPQAVLVSPIATETMLVAILSARIAQSLAVRLGVRTLTRNALGTALEVLTGPIGIAVLALSTVYDIYNAKWTAVEACQETLWQSYREMQQVYTGPAFIHNMTGATVAGLEQQLQTDREATRLELDRFFDGILVQATSPGFLAFLEHREKPESLKAVKQVAAVFGRDLIEMPFALKYALTSDMEAGRATAMIQMHGRAFVDLYARQPKALAQVMQHTRHHDLVLDVLHSEDPSAGLLFYKRSLDRFGSLDARQMDALILIRQLHPTKRPEDIKKDVLTILGASADRLAALKQQAPETAATVVDWTLHGQMSGTMMQRLAAHANAALLFSLPIQLGPDAFTKILQAADEATLVQFVRDFTPTGGPLAQSQAVMLLREDGPGHLRMYASSGGTRAVLARHAVIQEYGGRLTPETDHTLRWLVTYTSVNAQSIRKSTLDNLQTLGIASCPHILALLAAGVIASMGLTLPLTIVVALVVLPLGMVWFRVFRFTLPRRRRDLPARPADPEAISVQPMRPIIQEIPASGRHLLEK